MTLIGCLVREPSSTPPVPGGLEAVARACSPRVAPWRDEAVVFDASGLDRAIGSPAAIAREVARLSTERGLSVRIGLAGTTTAAWLLGHAQPGVSIAESGQEAEALAPIPIEALAVFGKGSGAPTGLRFTPDLECLPILKRWGLTTLGDFARLPRHEVHARLGPDGVRLHHAASGEEESPLAPLGEAVRFHERCDLEWPIEGLEPLAFVIGRLCDALEPRLAHADRGAVAIATQLRLVTRKAHERTLHVPAPMRDARIMRTLILLDLESHPPEAAIDNVEIDLEVAPGRIVVGALFDLTLPSPENLATLVARLGALMGESRVGSPRLVDTFDDHLRAVEPFTIGDRPAVSGAASAERRGAPGWSLRRLPLPITVQVRVEHGRPSRVLPVARDLAGGAVKQCAGPWRSSGAWWTFTRHAWDRDEWDVELPGGLYRLARDRSTNTWSIDAMLD